MKPLLLGFDAAGRQVRLTPEDRKTHMHVIGSSGSGKSKFLEWMMRQDLKNRQGFCLIDPHGKLYDDVVAYCARHVLDREIVLLDVSRPDTIVGFNPFQRTPGGDVAVQVDARITATMHAWGVQDTDQTPTLARTLRLIYTVMLEQNLGLPQVKHLIDFNAKDVRSFLVEKLQTPLIQSEWLELHQLRVGDWRQEMLSAKNRLFKLLTVEGIMRFMGLPGFSIDLRKIMDEGKILLVNLGLSKHLSYEGARTFGALLVTSFFETALQRESRVLGHDPKPYYLYMDEFQNFVSLDIANMLDQVRKFGLFLVMAHQRFGQLDEDIIDAALTNCRIRAVFGGLRVPNARQMAEELFIRELDPMKIKVAIYQTKFWPVLGRDKAYGKTYSRGHGHGFADSAASASFSTMGSGQSFFGGSDWFGPVMPASTSEMATSGSHLARSKSTTETETETFSESEVDLPIMIPVPFQELSSLQFYSPEEQLIELTGALKEQFERHCFIKIHQQKTQPMLVPLVERISTFDQDRSNLDWYIHRQMERQGGRPAGEVDLLLKERDAALLQEVNTQATTSIAVERESQVAADTNFPGTPIDPAAPIWKTFEETNRQKTLPTVASQSTDHERKRGPKPDLENHGKVLNIVGKYGNSWTTDENLGEICTALDEEHVPPPKTWAKRRPASLSWTRGLLNYPDLVIKAIKYHCEKAASHEV